MQQADIRSLRKDFINPYARLLPLGVGSQRKVYRMAETNPPGLEGYQPRWQVLNAVIGAQQTYQAKVDLPDHFHLLAVLTSATGELLPGNFRAQFYDVFKKRRIQDRGVQNAQLGGASGAAFFLAEPYEFDIPRSQIKVVMQNLLATPSTVQVAFYGLCAPFTGNDASQP